MTNLEQRFTQGLAIMHLKTSQLCESFFFFFFQQDQIFPRNFATWLLRVWNKAAPTTMHIERRVPASNVEGQSTTTTRLVSMSSQNTAAQCIFVPVYFKSKVFFLFILIIVGNLTD